VPQNRRGIADQRYFRFAIARRLFRIGIDSNNGNFLIESPHRHRIKFRADRQHRIGLAPQLMAERQRDAERTAAVEHAAPAPIGQHGRLQQVGKLRHLR